MAGGYIDDDDDNLFDQLDDPLGVTQGAPAPKHVKESIPDVSEVAGSTEAPCETLSDPVDDASDRLATEDPVDATESTRAPAAAAEDLVDATESTRSPAAASVPNETKGPCHWCEKGECWDHGQIQRPEISRPAPRAAGTMAESSSYSSHDPSENASFRGGRPAFRPKSELDIKEKISKSLSQVLRHEREAISVRDDGFARYEDVLRLLGRFSTDQLVDIVEWSIDSHGNRRFEMALDVDGPDSGAWIRATRGHSLGVRVSTLPNGASPEARSELDERARAAARKIPFTVQTPAVRSHHQRPDRPDRHDRVERHDRPERHDRAERHDRPERQDRPERYDRQERHDRRERYDRLERYDRPERKHDLGGPPPPEPRREERQARPPREPMPQSAAEATPGLPQPPPPPGPPPSRSDVNSPVKSLASVPEETHPTALEAWPPSNSMGFGRSRKTFDGSDWSKKHPGDPEFYITFDKDEEIALLPHKDASPLGTGWQFGVVRGGGEAGWFPGQFAAPYESSP